MTARREFDPQRRTWAYILAVVLALTMVHALRTDWHYGFAYLHTERAPTLFGLVKYQVGDWDTDEAQLKHYSEEIERRLRHERLYTLPPESAAEHRAEIAAFEQLVWTGRVFRITVIGALVAALASIAIWSRWLITAVLLLAPASAMFAGLLFVGSAAACVREIWGYGFDEATSGVRQSVTPQAVASLWLWGVLFLAALALWIVDRLRDGPPPRQDLDASDFD